MPRPIQATIHSEALRFMSSHCDGRQFYFIATEAPGTEVDLFCPAYRVLEAGQIPRAVDITHPATFMIPRPDLAALTRLRQCYPAAQVTEHYAADRRFLFTRVEVGVAELGAGRAPP